jgi:uncharacterized membrane protein YqjE
MASNFNYATDNGRTLGQIIKELTADFSTLFRSEVALLKLELMDTGAKLGGGVAMFAAAAFVALFGIAFLFVTIVLGLVALGVPAWLSALIVTVVLLAGAGVLALLGKRKFAQIEFVPKESVQQLKNDIEFIKTSLGQGASDGSR